MIKIRKEKRVDKILKIKKNTKIKKSKKNKKNKNHKINFGVISLKFLLNQSKIYNNNLSDKREYRHYYVNLCKDYLVVVCSIFDKKLMTNYFPEMLE